MSHHLRGVDRTIMVHHDSIFHEPITNATRFALMIG